MKGRKHHAKGGGGIMKAGGNPYVEKEAEEDKDGEVTERKHGGHAKKHRKHGGHIDGKHAKHRMDRKRGGRAHHDVEPGRGHKARARGGRTGSDTSPLSSANRTSGPEPQPKTQEGGMSRKRGGSV